jgi:hypothetical protein
MTKKSLILSILILSIALFSIISISAIDPTSLVEDDKNKLGESGLPKEVEAVSDIGEKFSEGDVTTAYLKKEWTKILEGSKYGRPFLGFLNLTDKIFSFFNPLWKYTLGIEFSWAWVFFISLFIWIAFIVVLYAPSKALINTNPLFTLIFAIIVASLAGSGGIIPWATDLLSTALTNLWLVGLSIIIGIVLMALYYRFFDSLEKQSEKETLGRAKESIKSHGKLSAKALERMAK